MRSFDAKVCYRYEGYNGYDLKDEIDFSVDAKDDRSATKKAREKFRKLVRHGDIVFMMLSGRRKVCT